MAIAISTKRVQLYLRIALAFVLLSVAGNLIRHIDEFWVRIVNDLWRIVYLTVLNYILYEVTFKMIRLNWKRLLPGLLLLVGHILMYSLGLTTWRFIGIMLRLYTPIPANASLNEIVEAQMEYSIGAVLFFGIIRHVYDYVTLKQAAQQLRIEKQQAELNYLKSQTNPHFLFNTLNNIYALAREKSDLAAESVMRLSKILRFMLYETSGAHIAIEQELRIISDYIELEKLRYDESLFVNFNYDVEDPKQSMPPLLLIPLVENAFKHGVAEARHRPYVDIHLSVRNLQLQFVVKNSYVAGESMKENIGLSNLRRQMELLYKEYRLLLQPGESVFTATLQINLATHV